VSLDPNTNILLVDDDLIASRIMKEHFTSLGYSFCKLASRVSEALAICRQEPPDIIVMDSHLEEEFDGLKAAEVIYKDYHIPLVILSGYPKEFLVKQNPVADLFICLVKPLLIEELLVAIGNILPHRQR